MVADLAERHEVPFAVVSQRTLDRLALHLDPGLPPANPLDVWGTGRDFEAQVQGCMEAMLDDPDTAIGVLFQDVRDGSYVAEGFTRAVVAAARGRTTPCAVVSNYASVSHRALALRVTEAGVPVIDGTVEGLRAVRHLMAFRDRRAAPRSMPAPVTAATREHWRARLAHPAPVSATEAAALLGDYGIPVAETLPADSAETAVAAANRLGWPVALKSAAEGLHPQDRGGWGGPQPAGRGCAAGRL
ncbi:hypothetical protein MASR1M32_00650 [Rhodobacter sp.]